MSNNNLIAPSINPEQLRAIIQRELPGLEFTLNHDESTHLVVMEFVRKVEGLRAAISDEESMVNPDAPNRVTEEAINRLRAKATEDYGLTPYIEGEKRKAAQTARTDLAGQFESMVEKFRPQILTHRFYADEGDPIDDAYEHTEWIRGDLPPQISEAVQWMKASVSSRA